MGLSQIAFDMPSSYDLSSLAVKQDDIRGRSAVQPELPERNFLILRRREKMTLVLIKLTRRANRA
jgi:hypothetical protein